MSALSSTTMSPKKPDAERAAKISPPATCGAMILRVTLNLSFNIFAVQPGCSPWKLAGCE